MSGELLCNWNNCARIIGGAQESLTLNLIFILKNKSRDKKLCSRSFRLLSSSICEGGRLCTFLVPF